MSTELFNAITAGDLGKAHSLLKNGADLHCRNDEGMTLLMRAAGLGKLDMVEMLLLMGANVNEKDAQGWTALMKALFNHELNCGFPEVVSALIAAGADVEACIGYGVRPLMLAAGYGEAGVIEVLLAAGADVNAKNEGGRTARLMAEAKDYVEVLNMLYLAEKSGGGSKKGACGTSATPEVNVIKFVRNPGR